MSDTLAYTKCPDSFTSVPCAASSRQIAQQVKAAAVSWGGSHRHEPSLCCRAQLDEHVAEHAYVMQKQEWRAQCLML
jgi:hypothetical protein